MFTVPPEIIEATARAVAERAVELLGDLSSASPWMVTDEAAAYLRIPLGTFQERAARGEFDAFVKREGRRAYYHRLDLDRHRGYDPAAGSPSGAAPRPRGPNA